MTQEIRLARASLHMWEEPCISGKNGSGTVFFTGCPLRCIFCQNREIALGDVGKAVSIERLVEIFFELKAKGAYNINLVTPTHYVPQIAQALEKAKDAGLKLPVVYNTGSYENVETLKMLDGLIDIYLPDLKYSGDTLAAELSGAADYTVFARPALREMLRQTGPLSLGDDGMARRGTIVRHLVIPGHTVNSMEVLRWLREELPEATVSVLMQYTPIGELPSPLDRPLTRREYRKIRDYVESLGWESGFIQQYGCSGTEKIPTFDLTGVHKSA